MTKTSTSTVTAIPPNSTYLSSLIRFSMSFIVCVDNPNVFPISKIRLCAPFNVSRCDFKLSRTPWPVINISSTPRWAFDIELCCWSEQSMSIDVSAFDVNRRFNNCSRSVSSASRRCFFWYQDCRAACGKGARVNYKKTFSQ